MKAVTIFFASLTVLGAISFVGCHAKTEDTSYSYDFTSNGCQAKQTFTDKGAYCASLIDFTTNSCAQAERTQEYNQACGASAAMGPKLQTQRPLLQTEKMGDRSAQSRSNGGLPAGIGGAPAEIVIKAHPASEIRPDAKESGEVSMITLQGSLIVDSITPSILGGMNLDDAESAFADTDLGECKLAVRQFVFAAKDSMTFIFRGSDKAGTAEGTGCAVRLSEIAKSGFNVEFKNVRAGNALRPMTIPKVILNVTGNVK